MKHSIATLHPKYSLPSMKKENKAQVLKIQLPKSLNFDSDQLDISSQAKA